MKLYIMRHGETDWNIKGKIQGSADIPLNENGILLAQQTRDGLKKAGITFDKIFSSPYIRAQRTAGIIADGCCNCAPELDGRIQEMDFGKYEGVSIQEVSEKAEYENMRNFFRNPEKYIAEEGSESYEDAIARVGDFFEDKILPLAESEQHCLIVCHGAIIRAFFVYLCHMELKQLWKLKQPNCSINIFDVTAKGTFLSEQAKIFYDETLIPKRKYT